jgi:malonyl-CoA O-methyltransferase
VQIDANEGYRLWAATYDSVPNPITSLERRILHSKIGSLSGRTVLDVATGTGFWLDYARLHGAIAFGVDLSSDMLAQAAMKPGACDRLVCGDMRHLPFRTSMADLAICSFAASYAPDPCEILSELARVARSLIVSDLHEEAMCAGWQRGFSADGRKYELRHWRHGIQKLDLCAGAIGLEIKWRLESRIGPPERKLFVAAGKEQLFDEARRIPAILSTCWERPC